jgi:hypothetical protein
MRWLNLTHWAFTKESAGSEISSRTVIAGVLRVSSRLGGTHMRKGGRQPLRNGFREGLRT